MGPDLIKKPQIGNNDEAMRSPMQTRRQSRMFSIDFDCLDGTDDQDRVVKKYTQVGQETNADVLLFLILFEKNNILFLMQPLLFHVKLFELSFGQIPRLS